MNIIKIIFRNIEAMKLLKIRKVASLIRDFYLDKNKDINDMDKTYKHAQEEIIMVGFTNIDIKSNKIIITLRRPGIFIGRKGENINAFKEYLNKNIKFCKNPEIDIKEDMIFDFIYPYLPDSDCLYELDDLLI